MWNWKLVWSAAIFSRQISYLPMVGTGGGGGTGNFWTVSTKGWQKNFKQVGLHSFANWFLTVSMLFCK